MIPQIINLGPIPINSFGLMVALALMAGIFILGRSFEYNGIKKHLAEKYVIWGGIGGLIGARLWYIFISHWDVVKADLWGAFTSSAGFVFYGGFIISFVILVTMAKRDKLSFWKFLDSFGPAMTLGYAVGRLGCQLSGDGDYGITTDSILGMSYATGVIPTAPGVLAFPTPFYESTISMLALYFLLKVEIAPKWQAAGKRFGLYLALLGIERLIIEFFRRNPKILSLSFELLVQILILLL